MKSRYITMLMLVLTVSHFAFSFQKEMTTSVPTTAQHVPTNLQILQYIFMSSGCLTFLVSAAPPLVDIYRFGKPTDFRIAALLMANGFLWASALSIDIAHLPKNEVTIVMAAVNALSFLEWFFIFGHSLYKRHALGAKPPNARNGSI